MIGGRKPLRALVSGLRGRVVEGADWGSVIALANHTLLTPTLFAALDESGKIEELPAEARAYLRFIHDCNRTRNIRLRAQLDEVVTELNRCGIVPLLLKGAVPLFLVENGTMPSRMTSDLDLGVKPSEEHPAVACVAERGYVALAGARGMSRAGDVGILELRPVSSTGPDLPEVVEREGRRVAIPHVRARATHWIMHDLLKEGDYWRGRIDLRHLYDLAHLAETEGLQWAGLRASMPDQLSRDALDVQLLALQHFFEVDIPIECKQRLNVRLRHWRRVFTAEYPLAGGALRLSGSLAWGVRRLSRQEGRDWRDLPDLSRRILRVLLGKDLRSKI